jgi:hypothetical protein
MRSLSAVILAAVFATAVAHAADDQKTKKKKDDPSQIGNRDTGKCLNFYSIEKEIALGKQLAEEVMRQVKTVDDPLLSEQVNRIGQNLVRNSDAKVPVTFRVIEDETPNAFALPGGHIFVNTGLIKIASEEDEFAGAIAHEIAHVAARHMTCRATKGQIVNILSLPLGMILGGWTGVAARQGAGVGVQTLPLSAGRTRPRLTIWACSICMPPGTIPMERSASSRSYKLFSAPSQAWQPKCGVHTPWTLSASTTRRRRSSAFCPVSPSIWSALRNITICASA